MRKLILSTCTAILFALIFVAYYDTYLHPDIRWFKQCAEISDTWEQKLRKNYASCYVFSGGSEIRSTIDPSYLLDHFALPTINAGAHAGFSSKCNVEAAMRHLKKGDTLIYSCLGNSLTLSLPASGLKFTWQRMGYKMFSDGLIPLNYQNIHNLMFGDCKHFCTYLIRLMTRPDRIYRYDKETIIHPSGWMDIHMDSIKNMPPPQPRSNDKSIVQLDSNYLIFLHQLQDICKKKGVTLILLIPIEYAHISHRLDRAHKILQLLEDGFMVIKDERLGIEPDINLFSDTNLHMNAQGVRKNMDILGEALKKRKFWTKKELKDFLLKNKVLLNHSEYSTMI